MDSLPNGKPGKNGSWVRDTTQPTECHLHPRLSRKVLFSSFLLFILKMAHKTDLDSVRRTNSVEGNQNSKESKIPVLLIDCENKSFSRLTGFKLTHHSCPCTVPHCDVSSRYFHTTRDPRTHTHTQILPNMVISTHRVRQLSRTTTVSHDMPLETKTTRVFNLHLNFVDPNSVSRSGQCKEVNLRRQ